MPHCTYSLGSQLSAFYFHLVRTKMTVISDTFAHPILSTNILSTGEPFPVGSWCASSSQQYAVVYRYNFLTSFPCCDVFTVVRPLVCCTVTRTTRLSMLPRLWYRTVFISSNPLVAIMLGLGGPSESLPTASVL